MATDKSEKGTTGRHVDAEKIGGVAHQNPDWGKEIPDRASRADVEDRTGTPKTTPPKTGAS